jgi:hypothetical protein
VVIAAIFMLHVTTTKAEALSDTTVYVMTIVVGMVIFVLAGGNTAQQTQPSLPESPETEPSKQGSPDAEPSSPEGPVTEPSSSEEPTSKNTGGLSFAMDASALGEDVVQLFGLTYRF